MTLAIEIAGYVLAAAVVSAALTYRRPDEEPETFPCPYCGEERPLLSLLGHMLTRGRCRGRVLSQRVGRVF